MLLLDVLPELCLRKIAEYAATIDAETERPHVSADLPFPFRDENDVVRDVIALAACSKNDSALALARYVAALSDPPTSAETVGAQVLTSDDEPKPKPDVTLAALKNACKTLGQPISGTKDKLAMRIDTMRKKKSRGRLTGLSLSRRIQAAKLYALFSRFPERYVKTAYALNAPDVTEANVADMPDNVDIRGSRPGTVSRRKAYRFAMKMYGDARSFRREIRARDDVRRATQARRRQELAEALTNRRPWLRIRPDSAICAQYVAGGPGAPSLERAVDVTEEMQFLYQHTQYPAILRELRAASRDTDREFGGPGYWRKRDMVKDGLIDHMDDDTPDGSEDDYDYDQREEETRREEAKRKAVRAWSNRTASDTSLLPRSLKALV